MIPGLSLPAAPTPAKAKRPQYRGIYWKKVAPAAVDGSLWENVIDLIPPELATFDAEELDGAFGNKQTSNLSSTALSGGSTPRGGPTHVALLDNKRATNAGIALARLGIPHGGGLTRAILGMDEHRLCLAKATSLLAVAPTAEEAELIRAFDGDVSQLGSTERYFAELIAIPRLTPRLRAWVVKMTFRSQAADLLERQGKLAASLEAMLASDALHVSLGLLLALGNALNAGKRTGGAQGEA